MKIDFKEEQHNIYFTVPMQLFITLEIKRPIIWGVVTLFSPKAPLPLKIKAARKIWKAYKSFQSLPEPTKENTGGNRNVLNLIELRDRFFRCCHLDKNRLDFIRDIFNFVIMIYAFDPPWRFMMDTVREWGTEMEWELRSKRELVTDDEGWWTDES